MSKSPKVINTPNLGQLQRLESELDSFINLYKKGSLLRDEDLTNINIYKAFLNNVHHDLNTLKSEIIKSKRLLKP